MLDWSIPLFLVGSIIYCVPLIMAKKSRHQHQDAIACINVFLGWTIVGWVFALALASSNGVSSTMKQCVSCRDFIGSLSRVCPHCRVANTSLRM